MIDTGSLARILLTARTRISRFDEREQLRDAAYSIVIASSKKRD